MTIFLQAGPDQMELVESVRQIPSIDPTLCHQDKMNAVRRTTPQQYLDRKALAKDITEIESHLSGETIRNFKSVRPFNPSGHYNTEWVQFHLDVELRPPLGSGLVSIVPPAPCPPTCMGLCAAVCMLETLWSKRSTCSKSYFCCRLGVAETTRRRMYKFTAVL
ncbi:unnamed protein product [Symbiodinium sp. KB8]|nr:unnamed protein product [Symbiodinium sp. KB8]